ncbi:MAG: NUDIX domain-containing protein [Pseudonocardia sp.]
MTSDAPLYERDPEAWDAQLAEGNATQPRKRISADVIIRDHVGRIMLVDPKYKPDWDLPGGMAEANESPYQAVQRELEEELGLTLNIGEILCVDWVAPHGPWDDLISFIFDGGELTGEQIAELKLLDGELKAFEFCNEEQARQRLRPYVWQRVAVALDALKTGHVKYLQNGHSLYLKSDETA